MKVIQEIQQEHNGRGGVGGGQRGEEGEGREAKGREREFTDRFTITDLMGKKKKKKRGTLTIKVIQKI